MWNNIPLHKHATSPCSALNSTQSSIWRLIPAVQLKAQSRHVLFITPFHKHHTCQLLREKRVKITLDRAVVALLFSPGSTALFGKCTDWAGIGIKSIAFCNRKMSPYRFKHCRESGRNPCRWPVRAAVRVTHTILKYFLQMPSTLWHNYTTIQLQHEPILPHGKKLSLGCVSHTKLLSFKNSRPWPGWTACKESVWLLKALMRGWLDLSSPSVFVPKRTGSVLTLNMDEMISFPFSALIWIRVKMCALVGILLRISASCLPFCLNETAPVVCYEKKKKKKANNPSLNKSRAKKENSCSGLPKRLWARD